MSEEHKHVWAKDGCWCGAKQCCYSEYAEVDQAVSCHSGSGADAVRELRICRGVADASGLCETHKDRE